MQQTIYTDAIQYSDITSKYPRIITDERQNTPNKGMTITLTVEQFTDLMHHTHNIRDIIGGDTGGVGSLPSEDPIIEERVNSLQNKLNQAMIIIENLSNQVSQLNDQLQSYIERDISVADYDVLLPGIQDENGNTVG